MQTRKRRIKKLEERAGVGSHPVLRLIVRQAGAKFALDVDQCIEILDECGALPTGPISLVNLLHVPPSLNAQELERYLRFGGQAHTR